jgi:hypothetical protein
MTPLSMLPRFASACIAGLLLAACATPRRPAGPPPPPAAPVRIVPSCVVSAEGLVAITVEVDDATGDTTFQGRPLSDAFPLTSRYAAEAGWYLRNEPIPEVVWPHVDARGVYVKYGRVRAVAPDSLSLLGYHHGVGVYGVLGDAPENFGVLYVPVRPGCWFQTYQFEGVGEMREGR